MNSEVDSKKAEMQDLMKKNPSDFGIRYTQLFVIPAIDQLENSLDLVRDTILPSALRQNGFYYDPEEKPAMPPLQMALLSNDDKCLWGYL